MADIDDVINVLAGTATPHARFRDWTRRRFGSFLPKCPGLLITENELVAGDIARALPEVSWETGWHHPENLAAEIATRAATPGAATSWPLVACVTIEPTWAVVAADLVSPDGHLIGMHVPDGTGSDIIAALQERGHTLMGWDTTQVSELYHSRRDRT